MRRMILILLTMVLMIAFLVGCTDYGNEAELNAVADTGEDLQIGPLECSEDRCIFRDTEHCMEYCGLEVQFPYTVSRCNRDGCTEAALETCEEYCQNNGYW